MCFGLLVLRLGALAGGFGTVRLYGSVRPGVCLFILFEVWCECGKLVTFRRLNSRHLAADDFKSSLPHTGVAGVVISSLQPKPM